MQIDVITAVPDLVEGPVHHSIVGRAVSDGMVGINVTDLRKFATDRHRKVDDYPYGGGGGMVLKPEPVFSAIDYLHDQARAAGGSIDEVIYMTPDGDRLTQEIANELSLRCHLIILAGHYKGVDERVRERLVTREISIGDYVLSGGELPALVLIDALVRLIPGVLGDSASALSDSFQDDLLGAPAYTRPAEYRGLRVPEVLLSGDHEKIIEWREKVRIERTKARRPDLLE